MLGINPHCIHADRVQLLRCGCTMNFHCGDLQVVAVSIGVHDKLSGLKEYILGQVRHKCHGMSRSAVSYPRFSGKGVSSVGKDVPPTFEVRLKHVPCMRERFPGDNSSRSTSVMRGSVRATPSLHCMSPGHMGSSWICPHHGLRPILSSPEQPLIWDLS